MTLNETILSILSDSEPASVDAIINLLLVGRLSTADHKDETRNLIATAGAPTTPANTSPRDVVDALESMKKSGEVVHSWSHGGSVYRKRTGYQLEQWRAVQAGKQPELL